MIEGTLGTCIRRKGVRLHRRNWGRQHLDHNHSQEEEGTCTGNQHTCLQRGTSYLGCLQWGHSHNPVGGSDTGHKFLRQSRLNLQERPLGHSCIQEEEESCTGSRHTCPQMDKSCQDSQQWDHSRSPVRDICNQRRSGRLNMLSPLGKPLGRSCIPQGRLERIQHLSAQPGGLPHTPFVRHRIVLWLGPALLWTGRS